MIRAPVVAAVAASIFILSSDALICSSFQPTARFSSWRIIPLSSSSSAATPAEPSSTVLDPKAERLKDDLIALAESTRRGFSSSRKDKENARKLINDLSKISPSKEPAASYYRENSNKTNNAAASVAGKWTLIYTDAPDITSLDAGPFSTAKLGRIGQDCSPPYIKNVIEWKKPDWAASLPFSGEDSSRVLQKVCCEASASPGKPTSVDLKLVGLEVVGSTPNGEVGDSGNGLNSKFLNGPAALLEGNPINLRGPLTAPFGKFDILYLDNEMRITKTYQGFYAVNIREENPWF